MRAIRIAAELGFSIEEKTLEAIRANASLINKIAEERVKQELLKTFASPDPYHGMLVFLDPNPVNLVNPVKISNIFG